MTGGKGEASVGTCVLGGGGGGCKGVPCGSQNLDQSKCVRDYFPFV